MAVGRCKLPHSVPLGLPVHEGIAPLTREPTTLCIALHPRFSAFEQFLNDLLFTFLDP